MESTIHKMSKVILHLHLDGSLRPETVQKWLEEDGEKLSLDEVQKSLMVEKDCKDLNEYLQKFDVPSKVLQTAERIEQSTYELYEDLAKQNVKYAEVRFAPSKHLDKGLTYNQVVEAAIKGMKRAEKDFDICGNLILCCMRGDNNQKENRQTLEVTKKYLNKGVCALDLAGAEAIFATENFENIFEEARKNNIPFTIHAGEADGPESIKKAIEFGAKRLGHGIRCIEDKKLMQEIRTKQILLEVCPISNIQTQVVEGNHPLEELYTNRMLISISPDNDTVSNTDIEQEYEWIIQNTDLQYRDLAQMNLNGINASFATPQLKANVKQEILKNAKELGLYEDELLR